MNDRLLSSLLILASLVSAALYNLRLSFGEYRRYRDARGLRGFVAAITYLAGVTALIGGSEAIRLSYPELVVPLRIVSGAGVFMFLAGLGFSVVSWRIGRGAVRDV